MNADTVRKDVVRWLETAVIGLRLCPFAARPMRLGQVDIAISEARGSDDLLAEIGDRIQWLASIPAAQVDTILIVIPHLLADFWDYNDFIHRAERQLVAAGWEGEFQLASFHPDYCFADAASDDPANFTNRAPYPIVHVLREASIEAALAAYPNPEDIPQRNIALLRGLSAAKLRALFPDIGDAQR